MSDKRKVFILGVTGYIGGAVFVRLKKAFPNFEFTALVRSESAFPRVRFAGVDHILHGSHSDLDKIASAASDADIVVNCADADDLDLTQFILRGMRARSSGPLPILLHTSGTGVVSDLAEGEFLPDAKKIWNDNSEADIRAIKPDQPHRNVDNEIFHAGEAKEVNAYIIAPSTIYGTGDGPIHRISQQIPTVVRSSLQLKKGIVVGKGTNLWNNVHINDLVDLYELVLRLALKGEDKASPYGKFYFGSVGEHCWGDVQRSVAVFLYNMNKLASPEAKSVALKDLIDETPMLKYVASNSRSKSDRGFALGWKPKAPSLEDTLASDVEATLVFT